MIYLQLMLTILNSMTELK